MGASEAALGAFGAELLIGPCGPGAAQAGWDSASLQMQGSSFALSLWRFYESWDYLPEDDGQGAGHFRPEVVEHQERAMRPREVEEVRVTLEGAVSASPSTGVRLSGFRHPELNQEFAEDPLCRLGGEPTWWSSDGQVFLYYAREQGHWRANSVRLAGGDGVQKVEHGRRAGCGFAHSSPALPDDGALAALLRVDWFEMVGEDWEPVQAANSPCSVVAFLFEARGMTLEERHSRGQDAFADRHVSGPVTFHGWRQRGTEVRLLLPPFPDRHVPHDDEESRGLVQAATSDQGGVTALGDPDIMVLSGASSKL